ncbi:NAD-dependent epimerase/dehydratase family protein [Thermoproteota archaeon]
MKVLITGGAGFIGHNLALYLLNRGWEVIVYDSLERSSKRAIEKIRSAGILLVSQESKLKTILGEVDVVVHAAAYISVEESIGYPEKYLINNSVFTYTLCKYISELSNQPHLVYISTAAVYGKPQQKVVTEDHPVEPLSPYGLSKLLGEYGVDYFIKVHNLRATILRLFNVYGFGQTGTYAGVITKFVERVHEKQPPLIYGDGKQTRDFIHVKDVCEAIRCAITKKVNGTFNVSSGKETSVQELARMILKLEDLKVEPIYVAAKQGDIIHSVGDPGKIKKALGFETHMDLMDGLGRLLLEEKNT